MSKYSKYFIFAITMTLLCRIPQPAATVEGNAAKKSFWSEAGFGFRFVFARPGLLTLLFYFMFINLVLPLSNTLVAPIVLSRWDAKTLGFVQSIAGLGMLVGTALMAAWGGPKKKVNGIWIFGVVCFLSSLILLLPLSVTTICVSFFIVMISAPIVNACSQTIWQRKTPADVQGKVFAVRRMFACGSTVRVWSSKMSRMSSEISSVARSSFTSRSMLSTRQRRFTRCLLTTDRSIPCFRD